MVTKVRTIDFLPEVFKTKTNEQFLSATLDQLVQQPSFNRIQGYIGSKFGYGTNRTDSYLAEPNKNRQDYQLEPTVIFKKKDTARAVDLITYTGILDGLKIQNGSIKNNSNLFSNQFYSWDSFCDLDKIINYAQYYWLPNGPEALNITTETLVNNLTYDVTIENSLYNFSNDGVPVEGDNPVLTLIRGGSYQFVVNQNSPFWIQTEPGVTGKNSARPNVSTREIYGVDFNGTEQGIMTFDVPLADAQNDWLYPNNLDIDLATTKTFNELNGGLLSNIKDIDGIKNLANKTLLFYGTKPNAIGNLSVFYDNLNYDVNDTSLTPATSITITGTTATTNVLTCASTSGFSVNEGINFAGAVFGGITNGGTFAVTATNSTTNTLTTTSTTGFSVNQPLSFGSTINGITAGTQYYINSVVSSTEFTITDTPNGTDLDITTTGSVSISAAFYGGMYYIKEIVDGTSFTISQEPNGPEAELVTASGNMVALVDQGLFEQQVASEINKHYYRINLIDTGNNDYIIRLTEAGLLPDNTKLTIKYGQTYIGRNFVKNSYAEILLIPVLTAALSTLYYQDGVNPERVGIIKLVDNPNNNFIDVEKDILGKLNYISPNGITFTNGLKVQFSGNILPETYKGDQYYVENVGRGIQLLPISEFETPELFGTPLTTPFDSVAYDSYPYGDTIFFPSAPDYILIARNSLDKNPWSRSNRWFHVDVLNTVIENSPSSPISTAALGNPENRAKRPIIEFYPSLKLFNSGITSIPPTSFINFDVTDAFTQVAGQPTFNPDGASSAFYDGATVIFAGDENIEVRNKVWRVEFESIDGVSAPVITLSVSPKGNISLGDQTVITLGETYLGKTFYFDGNGWTEAQQKTRVNQPPLYDLFDQNGISYGDTDFYPSSDFTGCTLFEYAIGSGTDDPVLLFPIKYSSDTNYSDIQFNVSLNSQQFNYLDNQQVVNKPVTDGYVYQYTTNTEYTRLLGWQTAIEESFQYQIFNFTYPGIPDTPEPNPVAPSVVCDIKVKDQQDSAWPVIVVYVNNARLSATQYTYTTTNNTTSISFDETPADGDPITVMLHSDQTSSSAYYQIPSNLDHNPFNEDISKINLGDIRGHYKSICNNVPSISGPAFGPNNYRDLGNLVPYGTRIIQSSASIVNCAAFLRNTNNNFFNALNYNSNEYTKFKGLLIETLTNNEYTPLQTPAFILDDALDKLTESRVDTNPFFWSDMVPSKNAQFINTYVFKTELYTSVFNLNRIYDFSNANYYSVLVYLTRRINGSLETMQLIRGIDYTVSETEPNLTITKDLQNNDVIVIKEYDQTYGSYVPNTPTKLGLYPSTLPKVILDSTFLTPTYFILGHDGSYNKLYGTYQNGVLNDYRDRVLLEFELRIYNNLKLSSTLPISPNEVIPGQFRDVGVSYAEYQNMYDYQFLNWIGVNRIDYAEHLYDPNKPFTYNYDGSTFKLNNQKIVKGGWRGIYLWLYDTCNPDTAPWEMLGLTDKPTWWENRYGTTPYTSDNTYMWQDIANGYVYNDGNPYINSSCVRDGLLNILPVDSLGKLKNPFEFLIGSYDVSKFSRPWKQGDVGPAEYAYLKSSNWPFDLVRLMALTKPAKFFGLGVDVDKYKFNQEFNQYLYNNRYRSTIADVDVYGNGTATHSYMNWIVDYLYQFGIEGTTTIQDSIQNLDVRLSYRLAGFSDKDLLKFYVEKGTTSSSNNSLLIPDDSYSVLLYDNQPTDTIIYSSIIVQKTQNGWKIFGNSQNKNYFISFVPIINGLIDTLQIDKTKADVPQNYSQNVIITPYGHEFPTIDELCTFLRGYGKYLLSQGVKFENIENGLELNWDQITYELLYWIDTGWEVGSTINVNPNARQIIINKENNIVQPLTIVKDNFVLNQNLIPISLNDVFVNRNGTEFSIKALNEGDAIAFLNANLSTMEHVIVFDNVTIFNDVIYNLATGLRQQRIFVSGSKSAEWNGTVNAAGFILNQDNIEEWKPNAKYTKGTIVRFKNDYYIANKVVILPKTTFDYNEWLKTSYEDIQKGLLPNPSTRAYEATLFYNTNNPNLENDGDLLSASLIGFRPRQYFTDANLTDGTQVNVYKNMITSKGTVDSITRLQGINLQQNQLNYNVYENWAIKSSEYGGLMNQNFIEITLDASKLTGNPSIVGIIRNDSVNGAQQLVPLYDVKNYGRPVATTNILPTLLGSYTEKLASAGYVNANDARGSAYDVSRLVNVDFNDIYKNDYIWLADKDNTWQIYTPVAVGAVLTIVYNNLNGNVTLVYDKPHGLLKNQLICILNFDARINGYYKVEDVIALESVRISFVLDNQINVIYGQGLTYLLQSQRLSTARDIDALPLLNADYAVNKVWVDQSVDGNWVVYEKTNNYESAIIDPISATTAFGGAVAYVPNVGYFISDVDEGTVYHYAKTNNGVYYLKNTITNGGEFGKTIIYTNDLLIISAPDDAVSQIFVYKIPPSSNINSIIQEQVISIIGGRVGDAMDISGDSNLLYLGAQDDETVLAFQRDKEFTYASAGISLSSATVVNQKQFTVSGNRLTSIDEGQTVNFVTSYTSIGATVLFNATAGSYLFRCSGDQRSKLTHGDKVAFTNTGPLSSRLYTIANEAYDAGTNRTTFYTVEMIFDTIPAGSTIYTVEFSDDSSVTVITGTYNSSANTTTFYTLEQIQYTATTGSIVYIASVNFSLVGSISPPMAVSGDKFGFSVATNHDGSKLFVGAPYTDYSVSLTNTGVVYMYDRLVENIEIQYDQRPTDPLLIVLAFIPTNQTRIYVNGELLSTSKYVVILNVIVIGTIGLFAGDIITVSSAQFVLTQQIYGFDNTGDLRQGELFGFSVDTNNFGSELLVGAPFDVINNVQTEGAVYRFTNEGKRFGTMTGLIAANLSEDTYLLINGYRVYMPAGNAATLANAINEAGVTNVFAYATEDGRLIIRLRDINLGPMNNKLNISVFNGNYLYEMGFTDYIKSQIIQDPHKQTRTQFGYTVRYNEENSFVVSAPVAIRYINTTFDFSNDFNIHNDTVFDNNLTIFEDSNIDAGAVYMFDYIQSYDESLTNIGKYAYAQSLNDIDQNYGAKPMYGTALSFNDGVVIIGTPNFQTDSFDGKVLVWTNESLVPNWHVFRAPNPVVDVEKIQKVSLYNNTNDENLTGLDFIDPLQGKLLGVIAENIDYITPTDPAGYNAPDNSTGNNVWTSEYVGKLWFNPSTTRFMNYHQNDNQYNSEYWGTVFEGSDVTVYTWVESNVIPVLYTGLGTPYDNTKYAITYVTDSNNNLVAKYYYWVRNTNIITTKLGKTLSDSVIEQYIANPKNSGISFFAALEPNVYAFYNSEEYINDVSTNLHLGFSSSANGPTGHLDFQLIRTNYPDDFLPGFPNVNKGYNEPVGLYDRMLDSFAGVDESGATVPDYTLPKLLRTGVNVRPRQSFFIDRLDALRNYLQYANEVVATYPINEFSNITFLSIQSEFVNTPNYWNNIYWWAEGYNDSTRAALEVAIYSDLYTLAATEGLIVGVATNSQNNREVYIYQNSEWVRIGVQNGTIQFSDKLWDYDKYGIGFGYGFDNNAFDYFPSTETRNIIRALNEQIYIGPLFKYRNISLTKLFEYIQSENIESQNYLPWLTKTSFADVGYTVRELTTNEKFQRDNQSLLEGYINEMKPYHVVLKEFYLQYSRTEEYAGNFTDYDLPAVWNEEQGRFISPQLLYGSSESTTNPVYPSYPDQFTSNDSIWTTQRYKDWFENYGLAVDTLYGVTVCNLKQFVSVNDLAIYVDSPDGLPVTGNIKVNNEIIGYTNINRETGLLTGISRAIEGTNAEAHFAGTPVYTDMPGITVLYSGRSYTDAPLVYAVADTTKYPAPKRAAKLKANMSGDKVISVDVIDTGDGYVVPPEIIFDSSLAYTSGILKINFVGYSVQYQTLDLITGELIYSEGISSNGLSILPNGYYYINAQPIFTLSSPSLFSIEENALVVSFYKTYNDAITGQNRVPFVNETLIGDDYQHRISIRARAIPTMVNDKIRTIKPTLRFDRTSYRSRISEWVPNEYYSSPYISIGNDTSSVTKLFASTEEGTIVPAGGSGTGAEFTINNVMLGGTYYADIETIGEDYVIGDVLRIQGSSLGGVSATELLTGTTLENSTLVEMVSTTGISVGDYITGVGIPNNAIVKSIVSNTNIMISLPALVSGTGPVLFLTGTVPNDCIIVVDDIDGNGGITEITVYGVAVDASLSSLQGAVLPILDLNSESGQAIVTVDYSYSDLKPGQVNGSNMYFYRTHTSYLYDDTGKNFIGSISGTTLTVDVIENGVTLVVGDSIYGEGIAGTCEITAFGTGSGGLGTYTVSTVQTVTTTQFNTGGGAIIRLSRPKFDPSSLSNLYYMEILNQGFIYNQGDTIVISGSLLGGSNTINDAKITVQAVTANGGIFSATIEGLSVGEFSQYYVKAIDYNETLQTGTVAIYENSTLTIPVSYSSFVWNGASNNDYGYLPEPIVNNYAYGYNTSSIVIYQGFIWQCIDANNDSEFDPTKWYPLASSDININALDRIEAYYSPTVGMPGKDAQQLVKGITYPNNVYYGNAFAPEDEFPLDTVVQSQPFYPVGVNVKAIAFNGTTFVAVAENASNTFVLTLTNTGVWSSYIIANKPLVVTDILYAEGQYVITTATTASPIYVSWDLVDWVSSGEVTGFDVLNWDQGGFNTSQVGVPNIPISSVINQNGTFYAVGKQILKSDDGVVWTESYRFPSVRLENNLNDIVYVNNLTFVGFVAVGVGYDVIADGGTSSPTIASQSRILTSINGTNWFTVTPSLTSSGFNSVTASQSLNRIVIVADNGETYYSSNSNNWLPGTISGSSVTTNINSVIYGNSVFVAVGDKTGTGATDPGLILTSVDGITWTQVSSQYITTNNLNYVYYADNFFYATGDNDTILKSANGTSWTNVSSVSVEDPYYVVQGNDFLYGYGPEELVAGVVTDTLSMYVNTAPGAYWDLDFNTSFWYKHTGFNMKVVTGQLDPFNTFSFAGAVANPARLSVFIVDEDTNLGTRIYEGITSDNLSTSYTVNWMNESIILNSPLASGYYVMVEVYEVGNGKELIRNNSKYLPLKEDPFNGDSYFEFNIKFESIINEPLVYVSQNGGILTKKVYEVDYFIENTSENLMKLVFRGQTYDSTTDYIVFAILGDSSTLISSTQYGYSIPETQVFVTDGATADFELDLDLISLEYDNIPNSIVELNGRRLIPYGTPGADYEFQTIGSQTFLHLYISVGGSGSDTVSITTFYDTRRQYLTTDLFTTTTLGGITTTKIAFVDVSATPVVLNFNTDPGFLTGDLIRIDGVQGTIELNQMNFYVEKISASEFLLFKDSSRLFPVIGPELSGFVSGGYAWLDSETVTVPYPTVPLGMPDMTYDESNRTWITINGDRLLPTATNYSSSAEFIGSISGTTLTVTSVTKGKLNIGQEISSIGIVLGTNVIAYISGFGGVGTYEVDTSQTVASATITTDYDNRLSIFANTTPSDNVLVTSMVTGESPNPMSFDVFVDKYSNGSVYRTNPSDGSWLTQDFNFNDTVMYFYNVSNLVDSLSYDLIVDTSGSVTYTYVQCDINEVKGVKVYNKTTITELTNTQFGITLFNGKPAVIFSSGVSAGDLVTVTITIGNVVEINGERIKFGQIDTVNNTLSELTRGVQGTSAARIHTQYSMGYGINPARKISDAAYADTWNSTSITTKGDPLQISTTETAIFLQNDGIS